MKKIFILLLALGLTSCYPAKTLEEKDHENTKDSVITSKSDDHNILDESSEIDDEAVRYEIQHWMRFGLKPKKKNFQKAEVLRVIDGDTIEIDIDGVKEVVRLIGVDSPESVHPDKNPEPFGKESSDFTKENLEGINVYLEKDLEDRDKYDRLLRYVWIDMPESFNLNEINEKLFNVKLLKEGYAKTLIIKPNVIYENIFKEIEEKAKLNQKGMWRDMNLIKGNKKTKIYYIPKDKYYDKIADDNIIFFKNEEEAVQNGYKKSKN